MENIELKKIKLLPSTIPTESEVYVEEVKIETKGVFMPNLSKTDKSFAFGKIIFAADKNIIGRIIVVNPWRQTAGPLNGKRIIQLPEMKLTFVEEEE